jgi:hypothetical protein
MIKFIRILYSWQNENNLKDYWINLNLNIINCLKDLH